MIRVALLALFLCGGEVLAQKGGYRSYSGGSSSVSRSYSAGSSPKPSASSSTPGRSYSSTSSNTSSLSKGVAGSAPVKSAPPPSFDSLGAAQAKKAESRTAYTASSTPKVSYTTPKGTSVDLSKKQEDVKRVREKVTQEKWVTRESRVNTTFAPYVVQPAPPAFGDHFGPFFWLWLLDQSSDRRAEWAYHHRDEMDPARLDALRVKDSELDNRLRRLEQSGKKPDHGYTPEGLDEDLQYDGGFVDAAVNPQPKASPVDESESWWVVGLVCFSVLLVVVIAGLSVYFVFFYRGF